MVLALTAGCAALQPQAGYRLANGGKPLANPPGVCVEIGLLTPGAKPECYQLAQTDTGEHVEPLPLDEFGYLFPPLKPLPKLAPVAVALPAAPAAAVLARPVSIAEHPLPSGFSALPAASLTAPPLRSATPAAQAASYRTQVVHFSTGAPFKLNSAHLSRANRAALVAFVNSLEHYRGIVSIRITGHTDRSGSAHFNQWLSRMRATSVQLRLLSLGVDPRSIVVRGVGSSQPRPHSRAAADNRYVDIEVVVRVPVE